MKSFHVVCLCLLFWMQTSAAGYLHSSGKQIVDGDNTPVILRGIGLGGWLVPEGYQLQIPGFGSPSAIRELIVDLIGETNTETFYDAYEANYVSETDIQKIAEWGFNSIRLPFNYRMLTPEDLPGIYLEDGFAILDQTLDWCEKYNLYLILDMHCAPGGQNAGNISDSDGEEARLWTETTNQDRTVAIWRKIAERYAQEEWIGGYDLLNEPVLPSGHSNSELKALLTRISSAIREVDSNHLLFMEGNWYATDFSGLTPPFDDNMAYSFHKYWSENTTSTIQSLLNIRKNYDVPLWLGEFGENSNHWAAAAIRLMEENEISWNWWTHKKIGTTTAPYSAPVAANYQKVLDYWNGNASNPGIIYAKSALLGMAESLKIENCTFLPDVLDAITRTDFNTVATPYADLRIPGVIACTDYDIGGQGIAYSDNDYQRTRWDVDQPWNQGYTYRNDGVDIEASDDPNGSAYDVGWIEDSEWLAYTVNVTIPGIYEIRIRTASTQAAGRLALLWDGNALASVLSIPSTGGWQNWTTRTIQDVEITEGTHQLKVSAQTGGFNLNQMEFVLIQSSFVAPEGWVQFGENGLLSPPYPNPFNSQTQSILKLETAKHIRATIWNVNGARVRSLDQGELSAGEHPIVWDGQTDDQNPAPSGIYFLKVKASGETASFKMLLAR